MATAAKEVDLGLIRVRSVGGRDAIHLGHSGEKVAVVSCKVDSPAQVTIERDFFRATHWQWQQVFDVYMRWKRAAEPGLFPPAAHKLTKEGADHPWRRERLPMSERKRKFFGQDGD